MDHLANNPSADDICKKSLGDGIQFIMTTPPLEASYSQSTSY